MSQIIVNSLLLGGIYVAIGAGFSIIWGIINIINLAHGTLIVLGFFITYFLFKGFGLDPFASLPLAGIALFIFGYVIQRSILNRIVKAPVFITLIVTYGVAILLENLMILLWTADYRSISVSYSGTFLRVWADTIIPVGRLAVLAISLLITLFLHLFISRTSTGKAIRAVRMNVDSSRLVGVNVGRIYCITVGVGSAVAGMVGSLLSVIYPISPISAGLYVGKAFVICVLGGLGDLRSIVLGGMLLALVETIGSAVVGVSFQNIVGFIILIIVLLIRPRGLMGKEFY